MSSHFVKGPAYGLSAEVKNKIAQKYDVQKELELRDWIEEITGIQLNGPFHQSLRDGVVLCELINCLQPGSVKKVNHSKVNWHQLENLSSFIRAIQDYGMKPHDIFEANDLFESGNMTQVQSTLLALANTAKTKGVDTHCCVGVRYADRQEREFNPEMLKAGQSVIGLQMGTNKCASQAGMTAYGTRRHLYDPRRPSQEDRWRPDQDNSISLQMGTNKLASQAGMTCPGTRRHVYDSRLGVERSYDSSTISLQMGTNQVATQTGMTAYGLGRQICDFKYCAPPPPPPAPPIAAGGGGGGGVVFNGNRGGGGGGGGGGFVAAQQEDEYAEDEEY